MHYKKSSSSLKVEELIIEEDRPAHIAKHEVTITEIKEVIKSDYVYIKSKYEKRWILIGKTKKSRFLSVIVGERGKENVFGLVTARPAHLTERNFYKELKKTQGG